MKRQLKVGVVGGLGLMSSPMARHWTVDGPVQVGRIHDRRTRDTRRDECRQAWRDHGVELVSNLHDVTAFPGLDGVFVCCGKNGDGLSIIATLAQGLISQMHYRTWRRSCSTRKYLCYRARL
jgi:hypothetical protein